MTFVWITNGRQEQTLNTEENIPEGWKQGRLKNKGHGWSKGLTKDNDDRIKKFTGRKKGGIPWNKGLTADTDGRVANNAKALIGIDRKSRRSSNKPATFDLNLQFSVHPDLNEETQRQRKF